MGSLTSPDARSSAASTSLQASTKADLVVFSNFCATFRRSWRALIPPEPPVKVDMLVVIVSLSALGGGLSRGARALLRHQRSYGNIIELQAWYLYCPIFPPTSSFWRGDANVMPAPARQSGNNREQWEDGLHWSLDMVNNLFCMSSEHSFLWISWFARRLVFELLEFASAWVIEVWCAELMVNMYQLIYFREELQWSSFDCIQYHNIVCCL